MQVIILNIKENNANIGLKEPTPVEGREVLAENSPQSRTSELNTSWRLRSKGIDNK